MFVQRRAQARQPEERRHYLHALSRADSLDLSPRFAVYQQAVHLIVGLVVVVGVVLIPSPWGVFAGFVYCLIGPLIFFGGSIIFPEPKKIPKLGM